MQETVHQSPVFDCWKSLLQVKLRLKEEEQWGEEEEFDVSDFVPDLSKLWHVV